MPPRSKLVNSDSQDQMLQQIIFGSLYRSLAPDLQEQMRVAIGLYTRERRLGVQFSDYSFIVFPMAKAYEGFLKQYLFQLRLLSSEEYQGRRFRIGRALNPDLRTNQRDEQWLYDDVVRLCSHELGQQLWGTWLQCRNRVFHYFPSAKTKRLTLLQAGEYLALMVTTMTEARHCQQDDQRGRGDQHNRGDQRGHRF